MSDPLGPGLTFEHDGTHTFMIVDFGPVMDVTDERPGLQGGGHTWAALARAIAARDAPGLLDGIELDPEADTFVARSSTLAPLEALAARLQVYFDDPDALRSLLDALGPSFGD